MALAFDSIVVAGGTGLVGREVLRLLAARAAKHPAQRVTALVRRKGSLAADLNEAVSIHEHVFDYEDGKAYTELFTQAEAPPVDAVFCCLGTTRKKAGSDEAFRQVDLVYPQRLLEAFAKANARGTYALVSSVGADGTSGLYLRTKHELEAAVKASGLRHIIVRPSLLDGDRQEDRLGEKLSLGVSRSLARFAREKLDLGAAYKYGPIEVTQVAKALTEATLADGAESRILEGKDLY
jgi:uncharacterized protein YbjT (DUF2867 family)